LLIVKKGELAHPQYINKLIIEVKEKFFKVCSDKYMKLADGFWLLPDFTRNTFSASVC